MAPVCWFAERMKTLTRSSPFTTSSVGPSRLASTGVRVFVSARCTLTRSSGVFVLSGPPGRGACSASAIGQTLVHDRQELASFSDALELVRSAIAELNAGARAEIADRTRDEDLSARGRGRDPGREMNVDSPDRAAGTLDLADMNTGSDP